MHRRARKGFRAVARAWLVLMVAYAGAPDSSAADQCELPNAGGGWVLPTSRSEEFRITLNPPDYRNADAVRRHFVFSSAWGSMLGSELAARSKYGCELQADPHLFPDLRVLLIGYRAARGQTDYFAAVCVPLLREIVRDWTPDESAVAKAVVDLTRWLRWVKGSALSSRSQELEYSEALIRAALARIYDEKSVMHALVAVDADSYGLLAAGPFREWIGQQRNGQLGIAPLSLCPTAVPRTSTGSPMPLHKRRIPVFPPSATAPAGVITIPRGEAGEDLPVAVIIGDARPREATPSGLYSMSPYAQAVDMKYCGRRHVLDLGDDPNGPASISASIKCQFTTILEFDDWMLLFCENCESARAAEAIAKLVIDDPDLRTIKDAETDVKTKGPYLISVTANGQ